MLWLELTIKHLSLDRYPCHYCFGDFGRHLLNLISDTVSRFQDEFYVFCTILVALLSYRQALPGFWGRRANFMRVKPPPWESNPFLFLRFLPPFFLKIYKKDTKSSLGDPTQSMGWWGASSFPLALIFKMCFYFKKHILKSTGCPNVPLGEVHSDIFSLHSFHAMLLTGVSIY